MGEMNIYSTKKNQILVTGGAGYIGGHLLVERLLKDRYNIVCLDNFKKYKIY
jgi:nucleoside-diphosphate-sugar epimerase